MTQRQTNLSAASTDNGKSQIKQIFCGLMQRLELTPKDVYELYNCMSANQRFSELRLKYGIPVKSEPITLPNGKRVNKHWLDPFYIDAVNAGSIKPPFAM